MSMRVHCNASGHCAQLRQSLSVPGAQFCGISMQTWSRASRVPIGAAAVRCHARACEADIAEPAMDVLDQAQADAMLDPMQGCSTSITNNVREDSTHAIPGAEVPWLQPHPEFIERLRGAYGRMISDVDSVYNAKSRAKSIAYFSKCTRTLVRRQAHPGTAHQVSGQIVVMRRFLWDECVGCSGLLQAALLQSTSVPVGIQVR